jgi:DNA polymerase-3 subunit gamma/tau
MVIAGAATFLASLGTATALSVRGARAGAATAAPAAGHDRPTVTDSAAAKPRTQGDSVAGATDAADSSHAIAPAESHGAETRLPPAPTPVSAPSAPGSAPRPTPGALADSQATETAYRQLARIYAGMRPDQVASVMTNLSDQEVAALLRRLAPRQAAAVLASLPAERAALLSRRLLQGTAHETPTP